MRNTRSVRWVGLLCAAALLAGCAGAGRVTVTDAWVRASPSAGQATGAYLVIKNAGQTDDRLLSVASDVSEKAEMHEMKDVDGMMEMSPVESIAAPAGGRAELKPGGLHIMLVGLKRELKAGDKVTLTLTFEEAGAIQVTAEVRDQ